MKPDPGVTAAAPGLIAHDVLDSTNAEALRLARAGARGPLWITARQQTAGRGRRGRSWISEPGNLYATLLLTEAGATQCWPQLSFVGALAVHDAIVEVAAASAPDLTIKWPNDVLLHGGKIAGVLIEGESSGAVALGIGINCASHPAGTDYPAADLSAAGVLPEKLFGVLASRTSRRLAQWNRGAGFAQIRADWLDRATGLGEQIRVRVADGELHGCFEALDPSGSLVLRLPAGGLATIAAADVFLPASTHAPRAG